MQVGHLTESLEKEMATHSSILAWRIPWTEEPGRPVYWGHKVLDTTERLNNNQTGSVASSRHVAHRPLEAGAVGHRGQQMTFVFRKSFPDTAKRSPLRPVGADLIGCPREGGTRCPKPR